MHGCLYWGWEEFSYDLSWSCSQDISQEGSHLKAGLELEDLLPWWLTHGCWLEASVHHWLLAEDCCLGILRGSFSVLIGSWLPLEQVMRERERAEGIEEEAPVPFSELVLKVTHCHFCHALFIRNESLHLAHTQGEVNQVPLATRRESNFNSFWT